MNTTLLIGWTTCDDANAAERIAQQLIERGLAACVQIEPEIQSFCRWEGELKCGTECRLMVKFSSDKQSKLETFLHANHPYETPEWIVVRPESVDPKYLAWALTEPKPVER